MSRPTRVIAIEEHFWAPEFVEHYPEAQTSRSPELRRRLEDFGELRLKEMDEAGIDMQVLSHAPSGPQRLSREIATDASRKVNDRLHAFIQTNPGRYAGFAALAAQEPEAAADELQRTIEDLDFKGALIHGLTDGRFLDEKFYWPIFARAEALDVPIYIHPARPLPAVIDAYYAPYKDSHPAIVQAAWGFGVETATHAIRLILSGVCSEYPKLKFLIGHLGEGIPFHLTRIDETLARPGNEPSHFRKVFTEHFYVTTSGFFSDHALRCCIEEMGLDHVMFSVDWPFVANKPGTDWLNAAPLTDDERERIAHVSATKLLRL